MARQRLRPLAPLSKENIDRLFKVPNHFPFDPRDSLESCWFWLGPHWTRPRKNGNDVKIPYFWPRFDNGKIGQEYAARFAWRVIYGTNSLPEGIWLIKNTQLCDDDLCISPYHHVSSSPDGWYEKKHGFKSVYGKNDSGYTVEELKQLEEKGQRPLRVVVKT